MNTDKTQADQLNLVPGMKIIASGQTVGKLDKVVRDPQSEKITYLQMLEGHLWGKKDVDIPVSAVDFTDEYTIYLKIDYRRYRFSGCDWFVFHHRWRPRLDEFSGRPIGLAVVRN